ncbi:LysR family transcriptional regulator substrate-binding protein [Mycobacterium sp. URHB0021]
MGWTVAEGPNRARRGRTGDTGRQKGQPRDCRPAAGCLCQDDDRLAASRSGLDRQHDGPRQCPRKEEIVVVVARGHRFRRDGGGVTLADLSDEPFVHYHPSNGTAVRVDQFAARPRRGSQSGPAHGQPAHGPPNSQRRGWECPSCRYRQRDIIAVVAAPSDNLVPQFLADLHRRGMPTRCDPG